MLAATQKEKSKGKKRQFAGKEVVKHCLICPVKMNPDIF